jgi:hypothetical protein
MNKKISFTIIMIGSTFALLYFGLITSEEKNYNSRILGSLKIFAQGGDEPPVINNLKIIEFNGTNYADVVNSRDVNLNSFTVLTWLNTNMNVTGRDIAFLINKGGIGTELPGHNLNYGLWFGNRERVNGIMLLLMNK